jgi:hypothetical protein
VTARSRQARPLGNGPRQLPTISRWPTPEALVSDLGRDATDRRRLRRILAAVDFDRLANALVIVALIPIAAKNALHEEASRRRFGDALARAIDEVDPLSIGFEIRDHVAALADRFAANPPAPGRPRLADRRTATQALRRLAGVRDIDARFLIALLAPPRRRPAIC